MWAGPTPGCPPEHVERLRRLVDDEPNLLDGFRRQLLRQFDVQTAVERAGGRQENHARRSGRERAL
jgi:hypothetical protein